LSTQLLDLDSFDFDILDRKLPLEIIEKFNGCQVLVETLPIKIWESKDTIKNVLKQYLLQQEYLIVTSLEE
jgi:Holliday junction resolvasome RuvABC ATP-dependent DNA helicase subunit